MNLGIVSWNPLVKLAVWAGWFPTPLLTGFWGMFSSRLLIAAVELGVFDLLAREPRSAKEVAREIGTDPVGTEALLNALNGFGYVRRSRGLYRNGRAVRRWLQADSRVPLDGAFGLFRVLWDEMDDMEGRLRSGDTRDFHANRGADFWQRYETGLAQFARLTSGEIVRKVKLDRSPLRLLDIGGGHAAYSARFCRRYPDLTAEVLDLPGATAIGASLVAGTDLSERITFRDGDLMNDAWGEDFDIVLLFNVIHLYTPEQIAEICVRARTALRSGGTFVVLDGAHRSGEGNLDATGGANELLFWILNSTRAYPEESVRSWMQDAGFSNVRTGHLTTVPQSALTVGRA